MNLYSIINSLNQKEKENFITFLAKRSKRNDTKNIKLFKILATGESNSTTICKALYDSDNKNAYHGLRKRLSDSLIDFTANKNLKDENATDIQIIKYILASRTFLLQKNYTSAYKLLDRAEAIATEHALFPMLNEIYHTKIQYASFSPNLDLDKLIKKQEINRKKHILEDQLNIAYSKLKIAINDINKRKEIIDFKTILKDTFTNANITLKQSLSYKSLYQIFAIANISALKNTRYFEIENFLLESYKDLSSKENNHQQLYYQIENVYIIANTLFRNKKFEKSQVFLSEMHDLMALKNKRYYGDFSSRYTLLKALNLNFSNSSSEAITLATTGLKNKQNSTEATLDFNLALIMFHFQQEDFKNAKKLISKLYHSDKWYIKKAGIDWVIKKNIAELLLLIEFKEENLFYSRFKSFKLQFSKYLQEINQTRILTFLNFAEQHYKYPERTKSEEFKSKTKTTFNLKNIYKEDIFVISFYAWLKSKIGKKQIYETTLQLINNT